MEKQRLADLEITVLESQESAELISTVKGHQTERISEITRKLPTIGRNLTEVVYETAQRFDSFHEQLDLPTQRQQLGGLNNGLEAMRRVDSQYYELPLAQARIHIAVGQGEDAALRGKKVTRDDLEGVRRLYQQAQTSAEEALVLYRGLSKNWPDWRKGYETLITAIGLSAICQEAIAIVGLPRKPRDDLAGYTIQNAALTHRGYNDLFTQGVFITREEALTALVNYAHALTIGMQQDHHRARGYLQAAQRELKNDPTILEGLAFLDGVLKEKVC